MTRAARWYRWTGRRPETFVGVDVRQSEIRVARYDRPPGGSASINTVRVPRSDLPEALSEAAARLDLPAEARTAAAVESSRVVLRHTSLPPMPEREVRPAIAYQLPQLVPGYGEEWVHDHILLGHQGENAARARECLVAALPRTVALEYHAGFQEAGLRLMSLEVRPLALWRYLFGAPARDRRSTVVPCLAVLDPDDRTADLAVFEGGALRYARLLAGWEPDDGDERIIERLVSEIKQSLLWYRDHHRGSPPEALLVTGEVAAGRGRGALAEHLGLKVFRARPAWTDADGIDPAFAAAAGLALKEAVLT